jgi:hypothetical protein
MHAICERITVAGNEIVGVRLAAAAYAHGFALALPEAAMARPTGVKPTGTHPVFQLIPIDGADNWEAAGLRSA